MVRLLPTLKAIIVKPRVQNSLGVQEQAIPEPKGNEVLLKVLKVGICGTDKDIVSGFYGEAPQGSEYLVIGHESLCRVEDAVNNSWLKKGELVVPTVRRSCPEKCVNCAKGMSDICLTGNYMEHGIKQLHGFAREFAVSDADYIVKLPEELADVGVLLEPLSIVEKAVQVAYVIQSSRMPWNPKKALVLGAGPVGLLATAVLTLKGLEVDTVATREEESLKAKLVRMTGAEYMNAKKIPLQTLSASYDMVLEVTGNPDIAVQAQQLAGINGIVGYLGIYREKMESEDAGRIFTSLVLGNKVHFGSVNANKTHFELGVKDMAEMKRKWGSFLSSFITKILPPDEVSHAFDSDSEDEIKTVIEFVHTP